MANYQHYRSPFGDTTFTKVFVGGLAWETPTEEMRSYFEQFGEILEAVIITDKVTSKSKGYGFVTFGDAEAAKRACADPNPVIGGRRANCNIASFGRPRPSPPRGRFQGGATTSHQGGVALQDHGLGKVVGSSYSGGSGPLPPPPPPPPLPQTAIYPSYGYPTYTPHYGYHQQQAMYNQQMQQQQQYYNQVYGASSSNMGSPYYYGYSMQAPSRGTYPAPQAQHIQAPSYLYYPTQMEGPLSPYPPPPTLVQPLQLPTARHSFPSPSDTFTAQRNLTDLDAQGGGSQSPNT